MHTGLGSKSSPIFISDDEEDAYSHDIEILSPSASNSSKSSLVLQYQGPVTRSQKSSRNTNKVIKLPAVVETSSNCKKRKRKPEHSVAPVHPPAGPPGSHKNKKAKQERLTHLHLDRDSHFELDYGSYLATPMRSDHHTSSNHHSTAPPAHYIPSTHDYDDNDDGDLSLLSSSEWVNSMARAAEPSEDMTYSSWKPPPTYGSPPPQGYPLEEFDTVPEPFPSASTSTTLSNATSTSNSVQQPPPPVSPAKKIIGMPIEKDGDGKRGAFKVTPSTTFEGSPGITFPHVPIPQNTLIVEQLPKTCRTSAFIRSWCEKACGSYPVFFAIEPSSAKALVELPSAMLAKKAWGSPKLGKELSGLSSVALKGKPREDLIRVWWYTPPLTQALTFERKELEEGEIEDEPTMEDTTPKETKKERKARLAKQVKEEKTRKREKAIAAAAALQKEKSARSQAQAQAETEAARASSSASVPDPFPEKFFDPFMLSSVIGMHMSYPPNHIHPPVPEYWNIPGVMPPFLPPMPTSLPPPLPPPPESQAQWDNWNTALHDNGHTDLNHLPDPYDANYPDDDRMEVEDVDMELSSPVVTTHSIPSHPHANVYKIDLPSTSTSVTKDSTYDPRTSPHPSDSHRGLPTPTPTPPNEGSGSVSVTKPLGDSHIPVSAAPSEPRAMKNAPREPSFTKRSLLARQKELEERILRTKLELGRKGQQVAKPISTSTSTSSQSGTIPPSPVAPIINEDTNASDVSSDKRELEQNLRQLVLASQKRRKAAAADSSDTSTPAIAITRPVADSLSSAPVTPTYAPTSSDSPAPPVQPALTVTKSSLDDMALSFLNETIQTLQPVSAPSVSISVSTRPGTPTTAPPNQQGLKAIPPSTTLQPTSVNPSSNQSSLAAKRLQLEQNIAETKQLMDKLSKVTTKQERDSIFARIREISRNSQDDKDSAPSTPTPAPVAYPAFLTAHIKSPWPDSIVGGGILILSDDEDEEDDA